MIMIEDAEAGKPWLSCRIKGSAVMSMIFQQDFTKEHDLGFPVFLRSKKLWMPSMLPAA